MEKDSFPISECKVTDKKKAMEFFIHRLRVFASFSACFWLFSLYSACFENFTACFCVFFASFYSPRNNFSVSKAINL